jgi:hypothetical protein
MLVTVGASFAGLFEALLATLRAGNRVTEFFTFRDLTTPVDCPCVDRIAEAG